LQINVNLQYKNNEIAKMAFFAISLYRTLQNLAILQFIFLFLSERIT